ncbi:FIST C-terminal domain-containing protein [soil metagenome]
MKWASAISRKTSFEEAITECAEKIEAELGDGGVSLVFAFVTPHFAARYEKIYDLVSARLHPEFFIGCSGGGVIGGFEEVEHSPAVSLVAARLPGVRIKPFHLRSPLPDLDGPPDAWETLMSVAPGEDPQFIILADPYSIRSETLLSGLDYAFPNSPKIGGLASGGTSPGLNTLFLGGEVFTEGAVGVALTGNVVIDTVVAQGCRPIGELMSATECEGNWLHELDGLSAFETIQNLYGDLDERDKRLAQTTLFVGVLMDEFADDEPGAGDFLVRNIIGGDPQRGSIAVGENLQPGMRLRFHVRDAETSAEDLRAMLGNYAENPGETSGALLFSCVGRGEGLYGEPNFDSGIFRSHVGGVPVGGFFCNGEIGPVGGSTFLHGYTSSFALFKPRA